MIEESYTYEFALIYKLDERWFADCYPFRKRWEPTTILGPFTTSKEAEQAVEKAP